MITYLMKNSIDRGDFAIERVIYGDVLMVINFSMDFLALYITGKIMHNRQRPFFLTLSAVIGAVYSLVILSLDSDGIVGGTVSILAAFLLTFVAYGKQKFSVLIKNTAVFYIVNFALGGGITALCNLLNMWQNKQNVMINGTFDVVYGDIPLGLLVILGPLCGLFSLVSGKLIKKKSAQRKCSLSITLDQTSVCIDALVDSGNLLTEPISGKPVIITAFEAVRRLIPLELFSLFKSRDTSCLGICTYASRVRVIPTSTVNGKGILYALFPDRVTVDGKEVDVYIAISPDTESFDGFTAIVPNTVI